MNLPDFKPLLAQAGIAGDPFCTPLSGGANNQVFQVAVNEHRFLLKKYFQHPEDPRNRLQHEARFLTFAWQQGLRCIPEPLAWDEEAGLGLCRFVSGRDLQPNEIKAVYVQQALNFVIQLNQQRGHPEAQYIPDASERCWRLWDHVQHVEQRLAKLQQLSGTTALYEQARDFIRNHLVPYWQDFTHALQHQPDFETRNKPLHPTQHCLSPSDFGFHNSLLTPEDQLVFFDFEYAGWDDPAQLIGDFFCQVAVPAPLDLLDMFATHFLALFPSSDELLHRTKQLLPVHQVKWICIVLNHFLRVGQERRQFASQAEVAEEKQLQQLRLAQHLFEHLIGAPTP